MSRVPIDIHRLRNPHDIVRVYTERCDSSTAEKTRPRRYNSRKCTAVKHNGSGCCVLILRYGRRRIDVLRHTRPGRPARSPTIAILAPGERGTWPPAARRRGSVEAAASPQLSRWRRRAAAAAGRWRRAKGERTKTGRQILVVQSSGGGGHGPGRGDSRGRP